VSAYQPRFEHAEQQARGEAPPDPSQEEDVKVPAVLHQHAKRVREAIAQAQSFSAVGVGEPPDDAPEDHPRSVPGDEEVRDIPLRVSVGGIQGVFVRSLEPIGAGREEVGGEVRSEEFAVIASLPHFLFRYQLLLCPSVAVYIVGAINDLLFLLLPRWDAARTNMLAPRWKHRQKIYHQEQIEYEHVIILYSLAFDADRRRRTARFLR